VTNAFLLLAYFTVVPFEKPPVLHLLAVCTQYAMMQQHHRFSSGQSGHINNSCG